MKRTFILISISLSIIVNMTAQNSKTNFEKEWDKVTQFDKDDLPKSATKEVDKILKMAIAEKNTAQVIKSLLNKSKYEAMIDDTSSIEIFAELQKAIAQTNVESEKALLHSLLAELYIKYFNNDSWTISNRTDLADIVPDDMEEWTVSTFANKVAEHLNLSIEKANTLKKSTTKEYRDIIVLGENSETYYPTLYDFLMKRAIALSVDMPMNTRNRQALEDTGFKIDQLAVSADEFVKLNITNSLTLEYYQQYLKDLLSRNMTSTVILIELDKVKYLETISYSFRETKALAFLKQLETKYQSNETTAAIIEEIAKKLIEGHGEVKDEALTDAYEWYNKSIAKYPNYPLIENAKSMRTLLDRPQLDLQGKQIYYTDNDIKIDVRHKNLQSIDFQKVFKLYKVNSEKDSVLLKEYPIDYKSKISYLTEKQEWNIGKLEPGNYCLKSEALSKESSVFSFSVSRLTSYSRNPQKGDYEVYVVDRVTGKPIKDASISIYNSNTRETPLTTIKTNDLGLALFKNVKELNSDNYFNGYYTVKYGNDTYPEISINEDYYYRYGENVNRNESGVISIFADRAIYRPGQTVYFKSVVIDKSKKPAAKSKVSIELRNTSGEVVTKKDLTTNDFGSVASEFVLPQSGLMGRYTINVESSGIHKSISLNVEEYKRPTFEITFDKIEKTYSFGEEVTVKGHAKNFSGINLQDATVNYTIKGNKFSFWRYFGEETFSDAGKVLTKEDGTFEITFTPKAGDTNPAYPFSKDNIQQYTINAEVTDLNGETQNGDFSMRVGDVSMAINIDIAGKIEKSDETKIKISAMNLNGVDIDASGSYTVYTLTENDSIANKVLSKTFKVGEQAQMRAELNKLASAKYRIKITAKDDNGKDVENEKDFILYSYKDKMPPIKTNEWLAEKNTTFAPGKNAEIVFGVSDKEVNVLYQLYNNKTVFENKRIILSKENKTFTIPYKAEYGDEVYLTLTYVKDEKYYNQNILLQKEVEKIDTKLNVKLEVFRDKLRPGQEETWTISVKDTNDKPIDAELLASMYDMSLDKLAHTSNWSLDLPRIFKRGVRTYNYNSALNDYYVNSYNRDFWWFERHSANKHFSFDEFNLFNFEFVRAYLMKQSRSMRFAPSVSAPEMVTGSVSDVSSIQSNNSVVEEKALLGGASDQIDFSAGWGETGLIGRLTQKADAPQIRQNFNETAFFYPQLRTNEKGETLISFTVPESNTQWKFRTLAYDKNLKIGQLEQLVVSRKELMVTPNIPRFVREGDKTSISTKVSNLSENVIAGKVYIEFFDPLTDKVIDLNIANREQSFSLEKDASSSVAWLFDIPSNIDLLGCRIVASNEVFSDGEQHVLSVLSNRMLVTESMPFDATEIGENIFTYDKLKDNKSSTLQNYRLTFEYSSNPAWYAVQALPTLSNPTSENVVNWFAAYYVNTLGASIVKQYPQVTKMIEAWKKQGGNKETLVSKLQKDEELKNVLLAETPWVLEAKSETEQMQRLSLLFDLNNTKQQTEQATSKLASLQDDMGGWSWYKGMYPSRSMTQYLLYGYAKLQLVGSVEYNEQIKRMQMKALNFIDKEIVRDYENLKKNDKDWKKLKSISTNQLEYLYIRTFYRDIPITQEAREAERFYTSVISTNWKDISLYERSLLVTVLLQNGDKKIANKISNTISERSVTDKKFGMHWPNNKNKTFRSRNAVSEHVFLMDALQQTGASEQEMDLMKQWLVKQKQTQVWESTPATINAINALLSTGSDWFTTEKADHAIKVGNKTIATDNAELGTGYVKTTWERSEIKNDMGEVRITKDDKKPSFGTLYWQYYEDLNKVTAHKTSLNIDKQLFRTDQSSAGQSSLSSITAATPLKVGDKVTVRLTIRVDNDMDFVQIKDMRAPCFEPTETLSKTKWMNNTVYYQETRDASTNFYLDRLSKGTYVFEYQVYVNRAGTYSNGITSIQSMYAPEFVSHTQGITVTVE